MAMKVRSARIEDPDHLKLVIEPSGSGSEPRVPVLEDTDTYSIERWAPFYLIRPKTKRMSSVYATAAAFNTTQLMRGEVGNIFPVTLSPTRGQRIAAFAPVNLCRNVIRQHRIDARLILSEYYADKGMLGYVLDPTHPVCSWVVGTSGQICGKVADVIFDSKAYHKRYLCTRHKSVRNEHFAASRQALK